MYKLALLSLRALQLAIAVIIIGAAADAAKEWKLFASGQKLLAMPGLLYFSIAAGAFTVLVAVEGLALTFKDGVHYVAAVVADGLAMLLLVGSGCSLATWLGVFSGGANPQCANEDSLEYAQVAACDKFKHRMDADAAFLLLGFAVTLSLLLTSIFQRGVRQASVVSQTSSENTVQRKV